MELCPRACPIPVHMSRIRTDAHRRGERDGTEHQFVGILLITQSLINQVKSDLKKHLGIYVLEVFSPIFTIWPSVFQEHTSAAPGWQLVVGNWAAQCHLGLIHVNIY